MILNWLYLNFILYVCLPYQQFVNRLRIVCKLFVFGLKVVCKSFAFRLFLNSYPKKLKVAKKATQKKIIGETQKKQILSAFFYCDFIQFLSDFSFYFLNFFGWFYNLMLEKSSFIFVWFFGFWWFIFVWFFVGFFW